MFLYVPTTNPVKIREKCSIPKNFPKVTLPYVPPLACSVFVNRSENQFRGGHKQLHIVSDRQSDISDKKDDNFGSENCHISVLIYLFLLFFLKEALVLQSVHKQCKREDSKVK